MVSGTRSGPGLSTTGRAAPWTLPMAGTRSRAITGARPCPWPWPPHSRHGSAGPTAGGFPALVAIHLLATWWTTADPPARLRGQDRAGPPEPSRPHPPPWSDQPGAGGRSPRRQALPAWRPRQRPCPRTGYFRWWQGRSGETRRVRRGWGDDAIGVAPEAHRGPADTTQGG